MLTVERGINNNIHRLGVIVVKLKQTNLTNNIENKVKTFIQFKLFIIKRNK